MALENFMLLCFLTVPHLCYNNNVWNCMHEFSFLHDFNIAPEKAASLIIYAFISEYLKAVSFVMHCLGSEIFF